ncbi:titin homolog isoform X2 [Contarinia nasturtii]|uniref:titin homolog isoform X2 n=1 Tax=Contarinia nasturtii TaxID=265458 RepID=UPI0012D3D194|nr:titin homolog isoform X2 [Contarinia nasturtii]
MTSITKHQYDFTNGKCANKENVLSNGKQSEVTKSSSGIDSNFDWAEKEAISQQRKLRLIQVRQQSKEIAAQVRENVRKEEQRQIENINRIKRDELLNWRQKQTGIVVKNYEKCLEQIGEAHLNAARENAKERQFEEQKVKNRKLACKRGKMAAQKLKEEQALKSAKPTVNRVKQKQVVTISKAIQSSPESDTSTTSTSSSTSTDASVIFVETKKKPEVKVNIPTKMPLSPKRSVKMKSPARTEYNPSRYASANNSTATDISFTDSPMSDAPPLITKVSDLLGKKSSIKATSLRSSPHIAKTYKLDKSPVTCRNITRKTTQKPQINTVSSRLSRVIKTPSKSSGKSPIKVLPERKHFVPEFVKAKASSKTTTANASIQTAPQRTSKVQFYDHANKFSRQYDGSIDVIERVQNVIPLSAWEEAKKDSEADIIKRSELMNMKILAENRSKVALEKEKIRKDYDLMSIQLKEILDNNDLVHSFLETNEILSESRLKQLAEEKQQLMNDEFSKVLKQPAIITCPKINSKTSKSSTSNQCGEINVAQAKSQSTTKLNALKQSQKKENAKELQKDDTTSENILENTQPFLLDYVNERSNNLCDDINRCRNDHKDTDFNQGKLAALHDLLNKFNTFRRILCDEIKENNGDISHIDAERFMNEIDKVEEKKQEIMKEKPMEEVSSRKQTKQKQNRELDLSKREKLLKIKESCIDEKVRELFLREKKIEEQKKCSKKEDAKTRKDKKAIAMVTSNGAESMEDIPVRIVINVNKNEQSKEKTTEVVVNELKWSEKLKKTSTESIQAVPVSNGCGKIYPKTPAAKTKMVTLMDISSSSTSYTSYLSPPDQMKTRLTAKMEQSAISSNVNAAMPSENSPVNDSELLHYIIRMLGMSRTSIDQLNMSSVSTVKTPNSSIINVSNNRQLTSSSLTSTPISHSSSVSMEQIQSIDKAKLQQLAKYLAENNKLATKPRKDSKESGASSGVWDEILSKKNEPNSKSEKTENSKSKPSERRENNAMVEDSDDKLSRDDLIAKYDELAANCTKRIINLDTMISKVREEKQKLLENTLSSASSLITGQKEATEYMEYPQQEQKQQTEQSNNNISSPLSDSKGTNAPSSDFSSTSGTADISMPNENRAGLFAAKNKLLGESKDSGVGISRPVTSSDYRDSPDLKQNTKTVDSERQSKLLQNALHESKRDASFEPLLKDIPRANYRISSGGQIVYEQPQQKHQAEQIPTHSREKMVKPSPPPVAMARYSPHMEDELPHELSTITEIDTPQTSRLNATDATNLNETKNNSIKLTQADEASKLIYKAFPQLKDYIKLNPNTSQVSMASANDTDLTMAGTSAIANEHVEKLLEPFGSQVNELKYKTYDGDRPDVNNSRQLEDSELRMSYSKFPTHSEYAKSVPGLLDSQSLDKVDLSDDNSNSSLPDIVNELKSRKILDRSFEEAKGNYGNLDDLLVVGNPRAISLLTTESTVSDTLSEELEHELNSMGLAWVSTELKKSKKVSTSQSSDSSNHGERLHRSSNKQQSPSKLKAVQKMNHSKATNDSFVDKNLVATNSGTVEGTITTQKSESDQLAKSINLKDFLARQLMKHSSMSSSSSDSSLASIFLKSFLLQSDVKSPDTPQNRGKDKHRTSTPVDHSSGDGKDSSSKKMYRTLTSTAVGEMSKNQTESLTYFSNESHQLSSVRMSTTNSMSSTLSDERQN